MLMMPVTARQAMRWTVPLLLLVLALSEVPVVASASSCPYVTDPLNNHDIGCRNTACTGWASDPTVLIGCVAPPPPDPGETPTHYAERVVAYYVCMDLSDSPPDVAISSECGPSTYQIQV